MSRALPGACLLLVAFGGAARGQDCRAAIDANQRHARAIDHGLRQLDALDAEVERMQAFNAAVYVDPDEALRATVMVDYGARFVTLGAHCDDPATYDLSAGTSPLSLTGGVAWTPLDLALTIFALGRSDGVTLRPPAAGADAEAVVQYRGLIGARAQFTRWFEAGVARVGTARDDADAPSLAGVLDGEPAGPAWLLEVGVPRIGARIRLTTDDDRLRFSEAAVRDVPVADAWRAGLTWRTVSTEGRHVVTPEVEYTLTGDPDGGATPGLTAWAELAVESGDIGLRHARAGVRAPMLTTRVTRTSYSRFGVHIEQRGALSVHRGAGLRAASDVSAAVGAQYDVALSMRTPVMTVAFDFGVGFNVPEALDLHPGFADSLSLTMAIRLGSHW